MHDLTAASSAARGAWRVLFAALLLGAGGSAAAAGGNNFVEIARGLNGAGVSDYDAVNPLNGNLVAVVPLGGRFSAGLLNYGFQAVYNSRAWDFAVYCTNAPTPQPCVDHAFPVQSNNAGLGWMISMGELYEPVSRFSVADFTHFYWWRNHSLRDFLYVGADGAETVFSCDSGTDSNCASTNAVSATRFYSPGYEARLQVLESGAAIELDFDDGTTHRFEQKSWAPCSKPTRTCWKLTQIRDRANNAVNFSYSTSTAAPTLTATDTFGRRHVVQYTGAPAPVRRGDQDIGVYEYVVDYVEVNSHASGAALRFKFNYGGSSHVVSREFPHQQYAGEQISLDLPVPLLQRIEVPEVDDFTFSYNQSGTRGAGVLTGYVTPSHLATAFEFGEFRVPKPCNFNPASNQGGIPSFDDLPNFAYSHLWGVTRRTATDPFAAAGAAVATVVSYSLVNEDQAGLSCGRARAVRSTVTGPGNLKVERWFATPTVTESGWRTSDFGLPFTRSSTTAFDNGTVYLSSRTLDCTVHASSGCDEVNRRYVRYAVSEGVGAQLCEAGDSPTCVRRHSEPVAEYTTWGDQAKGVVRSDFDGLGNWRTVVEKSSGYGAASTPRTTRLEVNPGIGGSDVGVGAETITLGTGFFGKLPLPGSRWLTRQVTRRERSLLVDGSTSSLVERYCYAPATGLMTGTVTGDSGVMRGHWFARRANGLVEEDQSTVGTSLSPCSASSGPLRRYTFDTFGHITSSTLVNDARSSSEIEYERTFDAAGRLTQERDAAGLAVNYQNFDGLGRPQTITRTGLADVSAAYTAASSSAGAKLRMTSGARWFEQSFDGYGRPYREATPIPAASGGGARSIVTTTKRDVAGNVVEIARTPGNKDLMAYDVLGRKVSHDYADGTSATIAYTSDAAVVTTKGGSSARVELDAYGHSWRESAGLSGATSTFPIHCTEALYDAADRVVKRLRSNGACNGNGQVRQSVYTPGGVLSSVTTPEGGTTNYSSFDVFGNPQSIGTPEENLAQEFDFAGRLERVSTSGGATNLVKIAYGKASDCSRSASQSTNWCLGRVVRQERVNHFSRAQFSPEYSVVGALEYRNPDGSQSKLTTTIDYPDPAQTKKSRTFVQQYAHNEFGELTDFSYPIQSCTAPCGDVGPARVLTNAYDQEMLTGVKVGATSIAEYTYTDFGRIDAIAYPESRLALDYGWRPNNAQIARISARNGSTNAELWTTGDYEYNARGLIQAMDPHTAGTNPRATFDYDFANRLAASTVWSPGNDRYDQTFGYDANDNLTARTLRKNGSSIDATPPLVGSNNRIDGSGFSYDNAGRLTSDGCFDYTYDALDALVQVRSADSRPACQVEARHFYDATGERVLSICDKGCEKAPPTPPLPAFTLTLSAPSIAPGQSATLTWSAVQNAATCTASGGWSGSRALAGGSETVAPATPGSYAYTLTCTGSGGSTTHTVNLSVAVPPPLTCSNPPAQLSASAGDDAEISVSCSGGVNPPTYRWERSADGTNWTTVSDGGRISGATSNRLRVADTLDIDAGFYRVVVTPGDSGAATITTSAAHLEVLVGTIIGQVGGVTLNNLAVTNVSFGHAYPDIPIVLAQPASKTAAQDVRQIVQITYVNSNGFGARLRADLFEPTTAVQETVNFIVMLPGLWRMSDGKAVSANAQYNNGIVGKGLPGSSAHWERVGYRSDFGFPLAPVVLAQAQRFGGFNQGNNYPPNGWYEYNKIRVRNVGTRRFDTAVEVANNVASIADDTARAQTYWSGELAMERGTHTLGPGKVLIAGRSAVSVTDAWSRINFPVSIGATPRFVGGLSSYNESDGAALRYRRLIGTQVTLRAEEDSTTANGDVHAAEQVSYFASSGDFFITGARLTCSAPSIAQSPQGASVMLGASATLSVQASDATGYQWLRNGTPIAGATSSTLTLGPVVQGDAGIYEVEVSNACASSVSEEASVDVVSGTCQAPVITRQPDSQLNVFDGEAFRFDVGATGTAPLTYQWAYSGAPITGATSASLGGIANTSLTGTYSVTVSNACGAAPSNVAVLVVTTQAPYPAGVPVRVGDLVEAENYDLGGNGVAYLDNDAQNQGSATFRPGEGVDTWDLGGSWRGVGWTQPGEWTEYTIGAAASVPHVVDVMHAADWGQSGSSRTQVGPAGGGTEIALPETGGWDAFQLSTSSVPVAVATTPRQVLRLAHIDGAVNIDWLRVRPATPADRATVRVTDLFGSAAAGASLQGRVAAAGYTWAANGALFTDRRSVGGATGAAPVATVPYAAGANKASVVQAQLKPVGSAWLAVGFANAAATSWMTAAGQLWAYVTPAARFAVYANGTALALTGGERALPTEALFSASRYNQVRLTFDPVLRQARLYVNGSAVSEPLVVPTGFTPQLAFAGIAGSSVTAGTSMIDTFQVSDYDAGCAAPLVLSQPSPVTVNFGSAMALSASVQGATAYQWRRNGALIAGATSASYTVGSAGLADAGSYDLVASNACGAVQTRVVVATVRCDTPVFIVQPQDQMDAVVGTSVTFSASVSGTAPIAYRWLRNGVTVPGATSPALTIAGVERGDAGSVALDASNACGATLSRTATLRPVSRVAGYESCRYGDYCLYVNGQKAVTALEGRVPGLSPIDFGQIDSASSASVPGVLVYNEFPDGSAMPTQELFNNPPFQIRLAGAPFGEGFALPPGEPQEMSLEFVPTAPGTFVRDVGMIIGLAGQQISVPAIGRACAGACIAIGARDPADGELAHVTAVGGTATTALRITPLGGLGGLVTVSLSAAQDVGATFAVSGAACRPESTARSCVLSLDGVTDATATITIALAAGASALRAPIDVSVVHDEFARSFRLFASECVSGVCVVARAQRVSAGGTLDLGAYREGEPLAETIYVVNAGAGAVAIDQSTVGAPWSLARSAPSVASGAVATLAIGGAATYGDATRPLAVAGGGATWWSGSVHALGVRYVPIGLPGRMFFVRIPR